MCAYIIPAIRRLRQEDYCKPKFCLGYGETVLKRKRKLESMNHLPLFFSEIIFFNVNLLIHFGCECIVACVCRSDDSLEKLTLSFCHRGSQGSHSGCQTGGTCLYLLSQLCGLSKIIPCLLNCCMSFRISLTYV